MRATAPRSRLQADPSAGQPRRGRGAHAAAVVPLLAGRDGFSRRQHGAALGCRQPAHSSPASSRAGAAPRAPCVSSRRRSPGCRTAARIAPRRSCRGAPPRTSRAFRRWTRRPHTCATSPPPSTREIAKGDKALALAKQDVLLTVPASFDEVARELTLRAAQSAGLQNVTLLEEPQAAFYAWLDALGDCVAAPREGRRSRARLRRRRRHHRLQPDRGGRARRRSDARARRRRRAHPARRRQHGPGARAPAPAAARGRRPQGRHVAAPRPLAPGRLAKESLLSNPADNGAARHAARPRLAADRRHDHHDADARRRQAALLEGFFPAVAQRRDAGAAAARRPPGARPALRRRSRGHPAPRAVPAHPGAGGSSRRRRSAAARAAWRVRRMCSSTAA